LSEPAETLERSWPKFCPVCDRKADPNASLCGDCGERLAHQGYCPVCERYLRARVGTTCPKHEVTLESEPPRAEFPDRGESASDTRWVTVETFADALKAEVPRIRLEAEGIPTFVEGARMGSHSMYPVATGGVKLQVPQPLIADARVLLSQNWAPVSPEDDLDDAWEDLAPEPGAVRRPVMKAVILLVLFGPLLVTLIARLFRL
jgi:hypothetical protein